MYRKEVSDLQILESTYKENLKKGLLWLQIGYTCYQLWHFIDKFMDD